LNTAKAYLPNLGHWLTKIGACGHTAIRPFMTNHLELKPLSKSFVNGTLMAARFSLKAELAVLSIRRSRSLKTFPVTDETLGAQLT
jgi:hypothetical protein